MCFHPQEFYASFKDSVRHCDQYFQGESWSLSHQTIPSLLDQVCRTRALGQGIMPIQADKRRGIYMATFQYLQSRQMLSSDWSQGQVLLYLPEFQDLLLEEAQKQGCQLLVRSILKDY